MQQKIVLPETETRTIETFRAYIPVEVVVTPEMKKHLREFKEGLEGLRRKRNIILRGRSVDQILESMSKKIENEIDLDES